MNELMNSHGAGSHSGTESTTDTSGEMLRDWRKGMSDHVAYALLVYTGLQIFMTVKALGEGTSSLLPYIALVVLVAAIIPACRWFERRWTGMSDEEATDPSFAGAFRRDTVMLWLLAIGLPLVLTGLCKAIFALS
ncbi:hypothetical protein EH31_11850 [Erythrobacter longus]|uniref:Transmembrane protein n=1 Tax=Erythrobacter longus TaxID=1044 RepID=A0A074M8U2_ERYLO|nr:hypothetical protein EH31_11850 [Erythrobacter longus]